MPDRTSAELLQDFTAMGHSITLITDVIAGNDMVGELAADRQSRVDRNVEHLVLMRAKSDWGSESMTATANAITAGNGYTAS
jgi:hypothetical protein|tara:strand:- start:4735 stop:4980 length:246 start_codon:yes stop_codon:yes gene_type:complete